MERKRFEELVAEALASLPEQFRRRLDNVAFVVEAEPRQAATREQLIQRGHLLLGLYQGIPLTRRTSGYSGVMPDKITIFQRVIEQLAGGKEATIRVLVRDTVFHEIAHHFGMDEQKVRKWEQRHPGPMRAG